MRSDGMTIRKATDLAHKAIVMADTGAVQLQIELHTAMEPLADDWRRLEADPLNSLHHSYAWCAAWMKSQGNPAAILRGHENGRTVFILPLEIVRKAIFRTAQFMGGTHNNLNTGLFDAGYVVRIGERGAENIAVAIKNSLSGHADIVALSNIPLEWRGRRNPLAPLASIENQNRAFQLPLLANFETTLAQVNAKRRRKKFRGQTRRLAEVGGYSHVIATTHEEKHALLETFFIQKAERFRRLGMPDAFRDSAIKSFFHMLADARANGTDRVLELNALYLHGEYEGNIAAIAGLSRKDDHIICQFGSIDEAILPEASPGELLFWLMIEKACKENAALFDFGIGDQAYKRSWCPVETVQHDIFIPVNAKGAVARMTLMATVHAKAAIKANRRLYGWLQKARAITGTKSNQPQPAGDQENDS